MRTTVDRPDDVHRKLMAIAHDTRRTLSQTVTDLMRRAMGHDTCAAVSPSPRTGLPVLSFGTVITTEDVRALDDE
ncbi:MAG: antitoxin [Mycobacterium sp.]